MKPQHHLLSVGEIKLIAEALKMAASRHESCARFKPQTAGPHDRKAEAMRALRERFIPAASGASPRC